MKKNQNEKSFKDLSILVNLISANLPMQQSKTATKGQKKLELILERVQPLLELLNKKRKEILTDTALEKDGMLVINDKTGGYEYSKEGAKKRDELLDMLLLETFTHTPIQVSRPEGLESYTFLKGWVEGVDFEEEETL